MSWIKWIHPNLYYPVAKLTQKCYRDALEIYEIYEQDSYSKNNTRYDFNPTTCRFMIARIIEKASFELPNQILDRYLECYDLSPENRKEQDICKITVLYRIHSTRVKFLLNKKSTISFDFYVSDKRYFYDNSLYPTNSNISFEDLVWPVINDCLNVFQICAENKNHPNYRAVYRYAFTVLHFPR